MHRTMYRPLYRTVHRSSLALVLFATGLLAGSAEAQNPVRIRTMEGPDFMSFVRPANRAVIGVGLSTGGKGDTLGLEIIDVTREGPAAKAGIAVGNRLQEINGVSLRVSADDASDPLTADAGYRRLQRELGKVNVGDAVTLRVLDGGQTRTVTVTTMSPADLQRVSPVATTLSRSREALERRAALGLGLGSAGNARDTLGVFITSVVTDGPADKAGVVEGERIAAINGVDVRVPREDVGDGMAASARVSRFLRELDKVAPGDRVSLRVFSGGRYRDVTITAGKASEFGSGNSVRIQTDGMSFDVQRMLEEATRGRTLRFDGLPMIRTQPKMEPATPAPAPRSGTSTRALTRTAL